MWPAMNFRLLMHNCYRTFLGALVVSCAQEINLLPVLSGMKNQPGVFSFLGSL